MACYVVTLRQSYSGSQVINRFSYVSTTEPVSILGSHGVLKYMGAFPVTDGSFPAATILGKLQLLQNGGVTFEEIEAENLYDPTDFYVFPWTVSVVGARGDGVAQSPVLSYGLRTNRVTRAIGRGTKRFVGVDSLCVGSEGIINGTGLPLVQDVADKMSAVLNPTDVSTEGSYTPAVFQYAKYTTDSGKTAYRPQASEGLQLAHAAIGVTWEAYTTVRSQVSRQYGRGA